jgi:hypothetical protein
MPWRAVQPEATVAPALPVLAMTTVNIMRRVVAMALVHRLRVSRGKVDADASFGFTRADHCQRNNTHGAGAYRQ